MFARMRVSRSKSKVKKGIILNNHLLKPPYTGGLIMFLSIAASSFNLDKALIEQIREEERNYNKSTSLDEFKKWYDR